MQKNYKMSIMKNAIDSIQTGAEDFISGENKRLVSSIRNIHAGLLLLYKEKLCTLSPEHDKTLLIRPKLLPYLENNKLIFKSQSKNKTVNVNEILDRFKSLNIKIDRDTLYEIGELRNRVEHYFSEEPIERFREIIAKCVDLINDFLDKHLKINPIEIFGENCWGILIKQKEIYDNLKKKCLSSYENLDLKYDTIRNSIAELKCNECFSDLVEAINRDDVYPNIRLSCVACLYNFKFLDVIEDFLHENLGELTNIMDGGDALVDTCPSCNMHTYVYDCSCCIVCDEKLEYVECSICEEALSMDDQENDGLCSYHAHLWNKD